MGRQKVNAETPTESMGDGSSRFGTGLPKHSGETFSSPVSDSFPSCIVFDTPWVARIAEADVACG
jgi:hypothetical protein